MFTTVTNKTRRGQKDRTTDGTSNTRTGTNKKERDSTPAVPKGQPPFATWFAESTEPNAKKYKVGNTKEWNGDTYHFWDTQNHKANIKWHLHKAKTCRTRSKWLAAGSKPGPTVALPAVVEDEDIPTPKTNLPNGKDISALLTSALQLSSNNTITEALIANALAALMVHE
jgi:hypothetical protein